MGVNIYLLDRRPVKLSIGGFEGTAGSLRRYWKITEMNEERLKEHDAAKTAVSELPSPPAAMFADVEDMTLEFPHGPTIQAHRVIGWDEGRTSVTDMGWDYLPILGYAVRDKATGLFALHEERDEALHLIGPDRALELGLIDPAGRFIRHGQPTIAECTAIRTYIDGYAEADCVFDDGRHEKLLLGVRGRDLPNLAWLTGKKPMQIQNYP